MCGENDCILFVWFVFGYVVMVFVEWMECCIGVLGFIEMQEVYCVVDFFGNFFGVVVQFVVGGIGNYCDVWFGVGFVGFVCQWVGGN